MKWPEEKIEQLKKLCFEERPNVEIARILGFDIKDIHAARSRLGITIPKVKAAKESAAIKKDDFALQIIARGSYLDAEAGGGATYMVEAITIRLNHVALQAWLLSETMNSRDCYEDGKIGDAQWKSHQEEYNRRREAVTDQILDALGINIDPGNEGVSITQAQSEVFTVVHISRTKGAI